MTEGGTDRRTTILEAVIATITAEGIDAVNLRRVARDAHVSLATIYQLVGSRDELCVAAVELWMERQVHAPLSAPDSLPVQDRVVAVLRQALEPSLREPSMLSAYARLRMGPWGHRLRFRLQGNAAMEAIGSSLYVDLDPHLRRDVEAVLYHLMQSLILHVALGEISPDEVVPTLEAAVRRLLPSPGS